MNLSAEGEKRRILEALGSIETLKNVSRSWPRQQAALPCAVVTLAGERRADERDGAEYLTETEYYVRCFARTGTEADELAPKIRREMEKLGYQREFAWEESSEAVFQRVERYKKWIGYSGTSEKIDDGSGNWRIKFKSSGTLKFTNLGKWDGKLDVFCVGGGCAGGSGNWDGNNGYGKAGSGGYTKTQKSVQVTVNTAYSIVIGAGGQSAFAPGGSTSAFGVTANGGTKLGGGSGGGAYGNNQVNNGGSDGGNGDPQNAANIGIDHWGSPGKGQGTTTREFGEPTGTLYAGGGGAGGNGSAQAHGGAGGGGNGAWNGHQPTSGEANTGGGGGGMYYGLTNVGKGGSGIVVIRNHR